MVSKILMAFGLLIVFEVNASCSFISANFVTELSDPSYIKEIQVEVPKSAKFNRNFVKMVNNLKPANGFINSKPELIPSCL